MSAFLRVGTARGPILFSFLVLLLLTASATAFAQTNISGTINAYQRVNGINAAKTKLQVPSSAAFSVGDKVLVIQMKGAAVNITTTGATSGLITTINSAGLYEYGIVTGKTVDSLFLAGPLCRTYSVPDSVQVVRVPVYPGNVNVIGTLTCTPWPSAAGGGAGGIIAFEVGGTLTLSAAIDASSSGFRGGAVLVGNSFICSNTAINLATNSDGQKGENVSVTLPAAPNGRGRVANGGGGAGAGNTGGGGGGGYADGGNGGLQFNGAQCGSSSTIFSYGGQGLSPFSAPERAFFGGGGGGPQRDNGFAVPPGGAGGGIVLIKAASIAGGGQVIRANGEEVTGLSSDEGGAGGGAGGSIYLICPTYSGTLTVEAKGGKGSSNNNTLFATNCHGPGGGGGGGVAWFSNAATPAGVTTSTVGGAAGQVLNPSASCFSSDPTHGAQPGNAGSVLYNLTDNTLTALALRDTVACTPTSPVTLTIGTGYTNILWSTGANTPSATVPGVGTYTVQATTPTGCTIYDTAVVRLDSLFIGNDTTLCPGVTFTIIPRPAGNFTSYQWQNGSPANSFVVTGPGQYSVTAQTVAGCTLRDTINIFYDTIPRLRDTVVCTRDFVATLRYPTGFQNYLWSTGATTSSITVTQGGAYGVIALTQRNCTVGDTATILVDTMNIGPDTLLCELFAPIILGARPTGKYTSYLWSDGSTDSTLTVDTTGVYTLTTQTIFGCTQRDTVLVEIDLAPALTISTDDSVLCQGEEVQLSATVAPSGLQYIAWDFGDGTDSVRDTARVAHGFDLPGVYTVSVTALYRICPSTSVSRAIEVRPFPAINIGPDTSICPGAEPVLLTARLSGAADPLSYPVVWSTSDTARSILVRHPGTFWATATGNGCSASDSVIVIKDCYLDMPNSFTPNGDGVNEYFWPRQELSQGVVVFRMTIYNRWGQKVWETTRPDGRGWDGRFNGEPQPTGVYIYQVEAELKNGFREKYQGNVTLLR